MALVISCEVEVAQETFFFSLQFNFKDSSDIALVTCYI